MLPSNNQGRVVELVDTLVLGTSGASREGSSPSSPTKAGSGGSQSQLPGTHRVGTAERPFSKQAYYLRWDTFSSFFIPSHPAPTTFVKKNPNYSFARNAIIWQIKHICILTKSTMSNRGLFRFVFIVLFIVAVGGFAWYYLNYQQLKEEVGLSSDPAAQQEMYMQEVEDILVKVGKLIVLPEGEVPELATVQDAESLAAEQAFFEGSINGDKLLIYSQKALIYSPSRDILVNVGPIYVSDLPELAVEVRNGSDVGGAASGMGELLVSKFGYNVIDVGDAADFDYEATVLVNLSGVDTSVLEQELGVTAITELPAGEEGSTADVIIIIGGGAEVVEPVEAVERVETVEDVIEE